MTAVPFVQIEKGSIMFRCQRLLVLSLAVVAALPCGTARAHNLFVLVESREDGPDLVDVIFEHSPYPGKGTYNGPHLDRGKTWIELPGSKERVELDLEERTRLGKKFLQAETKTSGPRSIVHSCKWGVYNGRLDYFHGKYLDASTKAEVETFARTPDIPLDLVPSFVGDTLKVTVLFRGEPLPNTRVSIWSPGSKEKKQTTDSEGVIEVTDVKKGLWCFSATHTLQNETGEFGGESYKGVMHGSTVNLRLPLK